MLKNKERLKHMSTCMVYWAALHLLFAEHEITLVHAILFPNLKKINDLSLKGFKIKSNLTWNI